MYDPRRERVVQRRWQDLMEIQEEGEVIESTNKKLI
jgi:hypothetical protein